MVVMSNIVVLLKLQLFTVEYVSEDLEEKKLLGSGGYVFAKLTEQEEIKASLGVPQIFLGNLGRLNEDRFSKYYCKRCEKEYRGSPILSYESPNEELGEGIILIEKGEYRCRICERRRFRGKETVRLRWLCFCQTNRTRRNQSKSWSSSNIPRKCRKIK